MHPNQNRPERRRSWTTRLISAIALAAVAYGTVAYLLLPWLWRRYEHRRASHPDLADQPRFAVTGDGLPGDPLNLALVGEQTQLQDAMRAAGWYPADRLTVLSGFRIAEDVVRGRPYPDAPVSSLFVWGRKQDMAFELPVGHSPHRRHHVRFWRSPSRDEYGRHLWVGAATYDEGLTLSHETGQITHRIAPNIDAERDKVTGDLQRARLLDDLHKRPGILPIRSGRNGSGDPYYTDGMMAVAALRWPVPAGPLAGVRAETRP